MSIGGSENGNTARIDKVIWKHRPLWAMMQSEFESIQATNGSINKVENDRHGVMSRFVTQVRNLVSINLFSPKQGRI